MRPSQASRPPPRPQPPSEHPGTAEGVASLQTDPSPCLLHRVAGTRPSDMAEPPHTPRQRLRCSVVQFLAARDLGGCSEDGKPPGSRRCPALVSPRAPFPVSPAWAPAPGPLPSFSSVLRTTAKRASPGRRDRDNVAGVASFKIGWAGSTAFLFKNKTKNPKQTKSNGVSAVPPPRVSQIASVCHEALEQQASKWCPEVKLALTSAAGAAGEKAARCAQAPVRPPP